MPRPHVTPPRHVFEALIDLLDDDARSELYWALDAILERQTDRTGPVSQRTAQAA